MHKTQISSPLHSCAPFKAQWGSSLNDFEHVHSLKLIFFFHLHGGILVLFLRKTQHSRDVSSLKKFRKGWRGPCRAHSCVMGGLYKDKRKYVVSDRDSKPVFLFLLYFLKKLLNDLSSNGFLWLSCSLSAFSLNVCSSQAPHDPHPLNIIIIRYLLGKKIIKRSSDTCEHLSSL